MTSQSNYKEDLELVSSILAGNQESLLKLENLLDDLSPNLARFKLSEEESEELRQRLRIKLIVGDTAGPSLSQYAGQGPLGAFLRVTAVRVVLNYITRERGSEQQNVPSMPDFIADSKFDPIVEELKKSNGKQVETAISQSWSRLPQETKLLLQYYLLDKLSIDALSSIYKLHRATMARRIVVARQDWVRVMREVLKYEFSFESMQVDSLLRFVASHVEIDMDEIMEPSE